MDETQILAARRTLEIEDITNRFFIHPIGLYFTRLFYPTVVTPNQLSILSCLFGVLAAFSLTYYMDSFWYSLIGFFFSFLGSFSMVWMAN